MPTLPYPEIRGQGNIWDLSLWSVTARYRPSIRFPRSSRHDTIIASPIFEIQASFSAQSRRQIMCQVSLSPFLILCTFILSMRCIHRRIIAQFDESIIVRKLILFLLNNNSQPLKTDFRFRKYKCESQIIYLFSWINEQLFVISKRMSVIYLCMKNANYFSISPFA